MPIKTVYRQRLEAVPVIKGASCNKCGSEKAATDGFIPPGFHVINISGGYGDSFPPDMATLEMVICDSCLAEWVGTFKHPEVFLDTEEPVRVTTLGRNPEERVFFMGLVYLPGEEPPQEAQDLAHLNLSEASLMEPHYPLVGSIWSSRPPPRSIAARRTYQSRFQVTDFGFSWPEKEVVVVCRPLQPLLGREASLVVFPLKTWGSNFRLALPKHSRV